VGEEAYERERFVLVVRLPREVEIRIEDTYLHLGGTTRSTLGYHVTLLGPFRVESDKGVLNEGVRAVTQQFMAYTVQLAGLASFRAPNDNVVYLQLADPTQVVATHNTLLHALRDHITWSDPRYAEWMVAGYHPHVTLGLGLSDGELAEFLHVSDGHSFQAAFEVSRVCMARQLPHGPWEYVAEYPLFGELPLLQPGSTPCAR
jgi:2'-5' RNA ligase